MPPCLESFGKKNALLNYKEKKGSYNGEISSPQSRITLFNDGFVALCKKKNVLSVLLELTCSGSRLESAE